MRIDSVRNRVAENHVTLWPNDACDLLERCHGQGSSLDDDRVHAAVRERDGVRASRQVIGNTSAPIGPDCLDGARIQVYGAGIAALAAYVEDHARGMVLHPGFIHRPRTIHNPL